jgi:hypothetical protein
MQAMRAMGGEAHGMCTVAERHPKTEAASPGFSAGSSVGRLRAEVVNRIRMAFEVSKHLCATAVLLAAALLGCGGASPSRSASWTPDAQQTGGGAMEAQATSGEGHQVQLELRLARASKAPATAPGRPPTVEELAGGKASGKAVEVEPPASAPPPGASNPKSTAQTPDRAPLLVYNGRLHLAVFEAARALDAAEALARDAGGYLVQRSDDTITFRVPAGAFQTALQAATKLGDVLHREVSVRDVTEEFMDLQLRLRNAEAVRDRLQELLARAASVEDALKVERELERVTGEVEQLEGRIKLLKETIAFSTITLIFQPRRVERIDPQVTLPFPWLYRLRLTELLAL